MGGKRGTNGGAGLVRLGPFGGGGEEGEAAGAGPPGGHPCRRDTRLLAAFDSTQGFLNGGPAYRDAHQLLIRHNVLPVRGFPMLNPRWDSLAPESPNRPVFTWDISGPRCLWG